MKSDVSRLFARNDSSCVYEQVLADELARRLGKERCWRVRWPGSPPQAFPAAAEPSDAVSSNGAPQQTDADAAAFRKDANDVLLADGHDFLRECVEAAEPYPISGLFRCCAF